MATSYRQSVVARPVRRPTSFPRTLTAVLVAVFVVPAAASERDASSWRARQLIFQMEKHYADKALQVRALKELKELGPSAVPALLDGLEYRHYFLPGMCAKVLGEIADPRAIPALVRRIPREGFSQESEIRRALIRFGKRAVEPLLRIAAETGHRQRNAIAVLGEIGDSRAVPVLLQVLENGRFAERVAAAESLGRIGGDRVFDPLVRSLSAIPSGAMIGLGWLGDKRATPFLLNYAKTNKMDEDSIPSTSMRRALFRAMERIKDRRMTPFLLKWLKEKKPGRWDAVRVVGEIADERAVHPLVELRRDRMRRQLKEPGECGGQPGVNPGDPFPYLLRQALEKLAAKHPAKFVELLAHPDEDRRRIATEALLGGASAKALEKSIRVLASKDESLVHMALKRLQKSRSPALVDPLVDYLAKRKSAPYTLVINTWVSIGKPAVPKLIAALRHDNLLLYASAAEALARIDDPRAVDPMLDLVDRSRLLQSGPREAVLDFLGRHDSQRMRNVLIRAIQRDTIWSGVYPATTLAQLGDKRALAPLLAAMDNKLPYVRDKAATGLGTLSDPTTFDKFARYLDPRPNHGVASEWHLTVLRNLALIDERRTVAKLVSAFDGATPARKQLFSAEFAVLGATAVRPLLDIIKDRSRADEERLCALAGLSGCADRRAVPLLVELQDDDNPRIRGAALNALGRIEDLATVGPVIARMKKGTDREVLGLIRVLAQTGPVAVPSLVRFEPRSEQQKQAIVEALGKLRQFEATPFLLNIRSSDTATIRKIHHALAEIGDPRAAQRLVKWLSQKSAWQQHIAGWIAHIGPGAVPPLIQALASSDDQTVAYHIAPTLARIGDPRALSPLLKQLATSDGRLREQLIGSLGHLRHLGAIPELIKIVESNESEKHRLAAIKALGSIGDVRAFAVLRKASQAETPKAIRLEARYWLAWLPRSPR